MIFFKRLAASAAIGKRCLGIRMTVLRKNFVPNPCCPQKNLIAFTENFPAFQFCTHSRKMTPDSAEDILVNEEGDHSKETEQTTEQIFQEIAAGDPETLKKLKLLELEVALLREEECRVPDKMTKSNWVELLQYGSLNKKKKLLAFLRLNELKRINHLQKMEGKRELFMKYKEEQGFHFYGLSGHTMFMRIYEKSMNRLLAARQLKAKVEVVLDCSYQEYMSQLNLKACAKQIFYVLTDSRLHRYPCQVKLCNLDENDALGKILPKYVNGIYGNYSSCIHRESYLDLYPKEKLVYLSPHAKQDLIKFNHDDIYIIGAFVDKGTGVKASLAKAKEHNLRMAKFPLDEYLVWKKGHKSLPLNNVLTILLDMAFYNDWNKAFKNIPSRCLKEISYY